MTIPPGTCVSARAGKLSRHDAAATSDLMHAEAGESNFSEYVDNLDATLLPMVTKPRELKSLPPITILPADLNTH